MQEQTYLKQNASGNYIEIQKIGCFFRCACNMAEREAKKRGKYIYTLTSEQLNRLWDRASILGYIGDIKRSDGTVEKLCVKNSAGIATIALQELNLPGRFKEVATTSEEGSCWYGGANTTVNYRILKMRQNGPSKTHYIMVNEKNELLWDPHDPEIQNQKTLYVISYRYEER